MTERRAYSIHQTINLGFDLSEYNFIRYEGEFEGILDMKTWGRLNGSLLCCFTLLDGKKIKTYAWQNNNYFGLDRIPFGSLVRLQFKKNTKNFFVLTDVTVIEQRNPDE